MRKEQGAQEQRQSNKESNSAPPHRFKRLIECQKKKQPLIAEDILQDLSHVILGSTWRLVEDMLANPRPQALWLAVPYMRDMRIHRSKTIKVMRYNENNKGFESHRHEMSSRTSSNSHTQTVSTSFRTICTGTPELCASPRNSGRNPISTYTIDPSNDLGQEYYTLLIQRYPVEGTDE